MSKRTRRAAWLRADLSADANRRLLAMSTPYRWGLPEFTEAIIRLGQKYVNLVADFKEGSLVDITIEEADVKGRGLMIAVPPGAAAEQKDALDAAKAYGHTKHVIVKIMEIDR